MRRIVESYPFGCAQGRLFRKERERIGAAFFVAVCAVNTLKMGHPSAISTG